MSIQAEPIFDVPELTAQVALAAFPKRNIYLQLRDELGSIYEDKQFAERYAHDGQPAISPWRLALVTVVQFAENLPDRQAADAVRSRIDLKYLLGLELTDPGFDYSVLCEFRARLIAGDVVSLLLDHLLEILKEKGLLQSGGKQRTDSTHILAAVRDLSRLELVGKTLLHALNNLAVVTPQWLKEVVPADWLERYNARWEEYHLPKTKVKRHELGAQVGQDGLFLLNAIYAAGTPTWLREIPAIETLRQVWIQNFYEENGQLHWRLAGNIPPAVKSICSPFDTRARYNIKRETEWVGYKVHLTETCSADEPHLITHVVTTPATEQDTEVVDDLHTDCNAHPKDVNEVMRTCFSTLSRVLVIATVDPV
jgi:transposase